MKTQNQVYEYIKTNYTDPHEIINVKYSPLSLNNTNLILKNGINDESIIRKYEEGITIDGIESLDLDDAIWAEKTKNGYLVKVHISDVSEAIKIFSPLDIEALNRTTSIYRKEGILNMFPDSLSYDILSLNEFGEKLTLTMQIELDKNGNINTYKIYESTFKNLKRYDYENFMEDYMTFENEFHGLCQLIYEIALKRRNQRYVNGAALNFDESDRKSYINSYDFKTNASDKKIPSIIIEEFMILANICSALITTNSKINSIYRNHNGLNEKAFYNNRVGFHRGLALEKYSHFTSPIRRYADLVLHRVLKLVYLRKEENPYTEIDINIICKNINFKKIIIDTIGKDLDKELKTYQKIEKLKSQKGESNISTFTSDIRGFVSENKKIPLIMENEIINDLTNGEKGNWAWSIGIFFCSGNEKIKNCLKQVLLDEKKFSPKSIFNILNATKILSTDKDKLFDIIEEENGNNISITVKFNQKLLFKKQINYGKFSRTEAIGKLRHSITEKIVNYFCN